MFKGGSWSRTCKQCKKNGRVVSDSLNCGFDFDETTCDRTITHEFPELSDLNFMVYLCPVWYYHEYSYIYSLINDLRSSQINIMEQPYGIRCLMKLTEQYFSLLSEYKNKQVSNNDTVKE